MLFNIFITLKRIIIFTKGVSMRLTKEEFWEINELEQALSIVESLSRLLYENYDLINEYPQNDIVVLLEILFEKVKYLSDKFENFASCLIKK